MRPSLRSSGLVVVATALLVGGGAVPVAAAAGTASCSSAHPWDADGDGDADPVVGVPGENGQGMAIRFAGTATGIAGSVAVQAGKNGVPGADPDGALLGLGIVQGDADGDRCADVAVAAPQARVVGAAGVREFGSVTVLYGVPGAAPGTSRAQLIDAATLHLPAPQVASATRTLGPAAFGDFIGDGADDLAVVESVEGPNGTSRSADMLIISGRTGGLDLSQVQHVQVPALRLGGGDVTLATGSRIDPRVDDLAIAVGGGATGGTPRHADVAQHPVVDVVTGGSHFPQEAAVQELDLESPGVPGSDLTGRTSPATVVLADFDGNGHDDLAIGDPHANRVTVVYTGSSAPARTFQPGQDGVQGPTSDIEWGSRLAAGDFNDDGDSELVVSALDGSVAVLPGTHADGLTDVGDLRWTQATDGVPGAREADTRFGTFLLAGDFGRGRGDDLLVGDPRALSGGGSVTEFFGGRTRNVGLVKTGAAVVSEATAGVPGAPEPGDALGDG